MNTTTLSPRTIHSLVSLAFREAIDHAEDENHSRDLGSVDQIRRIKEAALQCLSRRLTAYKGAPLTGEEYRLLCGSFDEAAVSCDYFKILKYCEGHETMLRREVALS